MEFIATFTITATLVLLAAEIGSHLLSRSSH
jgi:hypothetical protein